MSDIMVREIRPGEIGVLVSLYGVCFEELYPEPTASSLLLTPGAWCHLAFCEVDGSALGFAIVRTIFDEAELLTIGVLPAARRRGAAIALLKAGFIAARSSGAHAIYLEVGEDNPAAMALYRKLGFRATGRRKNYYRRANRRQVAAILMMAELTNEIK